MTKRTRLLPVRPKPNRLVLELLEDRSLPSGMAGGACDSPPPTTDGSGTTAWDSPRGWHEPSTDARPASFSSDRDYGGMTPPDRAPTWGGGQDFRFDRPAVNQPDAIGRPPAPSFSAPPAGG